MDGPIGGDPNDSLQSRMIRAARLDPSLYGEVRDDPEALRQAILVVLLTAVATGIGFGEGDLQLIAKSAIFAMLGWFLSAQLTWLVGTRLLPERTPALEARGDGKSGDPVEGAAGAPATPAQLLRTIGFANAPGLVRLLGFVPELRMMVLVGTTAWMLVATVIAIREGLGFRSTARAAAVYLIIQVLAAPLVLLVARPETAPAP